MPKVKVTCQECGKEFEVVPAKIKAGRGKYCSKQCYYKSLRKRTGEHSPSWRGGNTKRICEVCGKEFEVRPAYMKKKGHGKYCSSKCYGKALSKIVGPNHPRYKKIKQICEECSKEFEVVPAKIKAGRGKYCSKACDNKARSRRFTGQKNPLWKPKIKMICQECGIEFELLPSALKRDGVGKYCSRKCGNKVLSRNAVGEKSSNWQGGKTQRNCEICGKQFEVTPSVIKKGKAKYCSTVCMGKSREGEKSWLWKGGISFEPYCPKFNNKFKDRVRAWFDYQCTECGQPQNNKKLGVHHVYYNKMACCEQNENGEYFYNIDGETVNVIGNPNKFVALCHSCHPKTNYNRVYWARYFEDIINNWYGGRSWLDE